MCTPPYCISLSYLSEMPPSPVPPLNATRLKTTLKMAISKLKFLQEKKTALTKQQRRQLADLLTAGKESSAKIRVENIIRDDIYIELLEYCELYCELLLARMSLILDMQRPLDSGLKDAVSSVVYAAHYTEIKEMIALGDMLRMRYGAEFATKVAENSGGDYVPAKIVKSCAIDPPQETLVDLYLCEIARAYGVPYSGLPEEDSSESDEEGGAKENALEEPVAEAIAEKPSVAKKPRKEQTDYDELKARFAALKR
ncbi:hypothetical protein CLUG_02939 [Clavispora lusitaniae ATCC 42720]|uniref:DUF292-domain-containing protein n=1 Tax=Clavispora lusitaniae (strain ATCC 42720) TaxID=306902 RepID=C4Y326_CLAL4|nr:uncharacterized protein CLUG_02939 [Clavispora lusitaniae ATCC 42720]EEQ38813.1 hypothetical protein CLUG_02939 [Clavispora lusitaniae ATCC 42720]